MSNSSTDIRPKWITLTAVGLPLILVAAAYLRAPALPYVWDDHKLIANNPLVQERGRITELLFSDLFSTASDDRSGLASEYFRPVTALTFWLEARCGERAATVGHTLSVLLHLIACGLCFRLCRKSGLGLAPSSAVVLFIGLHPIQTEAVYWNSARGDLLAAMFVLGAAVTAAGRRSPYARPAIAGMLLLLALASKETALAGLPLVLLFALTNRKAPGRGLRMGTAVACSIAVVIYLLWRSAVGVFLPGDSGLAGGAELIQDVITVYGTQLGWIALPFDLAAARDYVPYQGVPIAVTVAGLLATGAIALAAWRRGHRLALAAWLAYLATAILVGAAVRNIGVVAERYCYLPTVAVALFTADSIAALMSRATANRLLRPLPCLAWCTIAVVVVALFATTVWTRSYAWSSERTLFGSAIESTGSSEAVRLLASDLAHSDRDFQRAAVLYRARVERHPGDAGSWNNLAACLNELGRFEEALEAAQTSRRLDPSRRSAWLNLATAQAMTGRTGQALHTLDAYAQQRNSSTAAFPLDERYRQVRQLAQRAHNAKTATPRSIMDTDAN